MQIHKLFIIVLKELPQDFRWDKLYNQESIHIFVHNGILKLKRKKNKKITVITKNNMWNKYSIN
jgi:hypothetical protein